MFFFFHSDSGEYAHYYPCRLCIDACCLSHVWMSLFTSAVPPTASDPTYKTSHSDALPNNLMGCNLYVFTYRWPHFCVMLCVICTNPLGCLLISWSEDTAQWGGGAEEKMRACVRVRLQILTSTHRSCFFFFPEGTLLHLRKEQILLRVSSDTIFYVYTHTKYKH